MAANQLMDLKESNGETVTQETVETTPETEDNADLADHHRINYLPLEKTFCAEKSDELDSILRELNNLFSSVGAEITVTDGILAIDVNEEKFISMTKRKAGRKSKGMTKRMEEIMVYRETHTALETAKWMGLTRQTYYRRMKELRDENLYFSKNDENHE